jgi:hypothetical protein
MQWVLHHVAAMSGATEIYNNFDSAMALQNEWDSCAEDKWDSYEEGSPPIIDHDIPMIHFSPPSSPPRQFSPLSLPKSNIRSDSISLWSAENSSTKTIGFLQGQQFSTRQHKPIAYLSFVEEGSQQQMMPMADDSEIA